MIRHNGADPRRMTALQHYREAERLLLTAMQPDSYEYPVEGSIRYIAAAQVHATLALAAVTARIGGDSTMEAAGIDGPSSDGTMARD